MKDVAYFVGQIEEETNPERMSKKEALEFLEDLVSWLEGSIEGLRSDIENEEEEGDD